MNRTGKRAAQKAVKKLAKKAPAKKRTKQDRTEAYVKGLNNKAKRTTAEQARKAEEGVAAEAAETSKKATNKKDAAKASKARRAKKMPEIIADKIADGTLPAISDEVGKMLAAQAAEIRKHQSAAEGLKPVISDLVNKVAEDKKALAEAAESKEMTKEAKGKLLESVGKDLRRRESELVQKTNQRKGEREGIKAGFEKLLTIIEEHVVGDLLFSPPAEIDAAAGTTEPRPGLPVKLTSPPVVEGNYQRTAEDGTDCVVRVKGIREGLASIEVLADSGGKPKGHQETVMWALGAWLRLPDNFGPKEEQPMLALTQAPPDTGDPEEDARLAAGSAAPRIPEWNEMPPHVGVVYRVKVGEELHEVEAKDPKGINGLVCVVLSSTIYEPGEVKTFLLGMGEWTPVRPAEAPEPPDDGSDEEDESDLVHESAGGAADIS